MQRGAVRVRTVRCVHAAAANSACSSLSSAVTKSRSRISANEAAAPANATIAPTSRIVFSPCANEVRALDWTMPRSGEGVVAIVCAAPPAPKLEHSQVNHGHAASHAHAAANSHDPPPDRRLNKPKRNR
jgi:hypothetical protein